MDFIRQDSGVNNATDAMEQFSFLLLLKCFYEKIREDTFRNKEISAENLSDVFTDKGVEIKRFSDIFYEYYSDGRLKKDFFSLNSFSNDDEFISYANFDHRLFEKVESFTTFIPFKVRSEKILKVVVDYLDSVDINEALANDYDALITSMINSSVSSGQFTSPKPLISAIVKVINPQKGQSVYDPAMGTGRVLIESEKIVNGGLSHIRGNDISSFAGLIASVNLLLNGVDIDDLHVKNSFLFEDETQYDLIISGAPFGKEPNSAEYKYDYYDGSSSFEVLFLKHAMRKLAENGKAALIVPNNIFFNHSSDVVNLRRKLLTSFNFHSILSLPRGALTGVGAKVSVIFFDNSRKSDDIWFYGIKTERPFSKNNPLQDSHFSDFIESFLKRNETENSYLIDKKEILNDKYVNIPCEMPDNKKIEVFKFNDELMSLTNKKSEFDALFSDFTRLLEDNKQSHLVKKVKLGEIVKSRSGKKINKDNILEKGKYPVYGGNGVIGYHNDFNRDGDTILIGRVGYHCGNIHFVKGSIWLTTNVFSVELHRSVEVHLPYLAHLLTSLNLNQFSRGSAQTSISFSNIKDIEIDLPNYDQQKELSLWFDEIESKKNKLLELVDTHKEKITNIARASRISKCIKDG